MKASPNVQQWGRVCSFQTVYKLNRICCCEVSLLLNTLKCCYLLFLRKPTPTFPSSPLLVNNTVLHMAKEFKFLGVTFSSDASWTPHINTICLKTRKLVGMLFRKFYCHTDSHSLLKLYLSTVAPTWSMLALFGTLTSRKTLKQLSMFKNTL